MPQSIAQLIDAIRPDQWREKEGFSHDIAFYNGQILDGSKSDEEISFALREWLAEKQPCLFGRMAAGNLDLLTFCILTDRDLSQSDSYIKSKIERFRLLWKIEAIQGLKSGFIILVKTRLADLRMNASVGQVLLGNPTTRLLSSIRWKRASGCRAAASRPSVVCPVFRMNSLLIAHCAALFLRHIGYERKWL